MWTNTALRLEAGYFNIYCIEWILLRIIEVILEPKASYCLRETAIGMSSLNGLCPRASLIILLLDLRWRDTGTRRRRPPYLIREVHSKWTIYRVPRVGTINFHWIPTATGKHCEIWDPRVSSEKGLTSTTNTTRVGQPTKFPHYVYLQERKRHLNAGRGCD